VTVTEQDTAELAGLRAAGAVVAETIANMRRAAAPGITTAELDAVAARTFVGHGARSAPQVDYDFPGFTCISVNDEAVHGIPGARRLERGDLVKLDVTVELDGFYADACRSVVVGGGNPDAQRLIDAADEALDLAIAAAEAGTPLNAIGAAVEVTVTGHGYAVCEELTGHGIGRRIHEDPAVPNYYVEELDEPLHEGLVMTIEPIIAAGRGDIEETGDGWTVRTEDGSWVAHAEHTIVIQRGRPLILTA
jgi:methionyl aminopeptidase